MKAFLATLMLMLPFISSAQLLMLEGEPGSYILVDNRLTAYKATMLVNEHGLIAKDGKNKKQVWKASEVYWASVGKRHYWPVTGFEIMGTLRPRLIEHGLAELLDSGRVSLLRYDQQMNTGTINSGGSYVPMNNTVSTYLLQLATEENAVTIPMNRLSGKGPEFQAMLSPYFSSRPDLQAQLAKGEVRRRNLAAFFHAFNTGQPFVAKPEDADNE